MCHYCTEFSGGGPKASHYTVGALLNRDQLHILETSSSNAIYYEIRPVRLLVPSSPLPHPSANLGFSIENDADLLCREAESKTMKHNPRLLAIL
jgi:hypothetical protein